MGKFKVNDNVVIQQNDAETIRSILVGLTGKIRVEHISHDPVLYSVTINGIDYAFYEHELVEAGDPDRLRTFLDLTAWVEKNADLPLGDTPEKAIIRWWAQMAVKDMLGNYTVKDWADLMVRGTGPITSATVGDWVDNLWIEDNSEDPNHPADVIDGLLRDHFHRNEEA